MINLSPEFCFQLKEARRAAKLSQSELAACVGCKQSALSMFEQGQPTKLNEEVVRKLAEKFHLELQEEKQPERTLPAPSPVIIPSNPAYVVRGFCPNPSCPSNRPYTVASRTFYLPDREAADPIGGKFCALCGEVLEKRCPNCGAPVHAGAVCALCGDPYLHVTE